MEIDIEKNIVNIDRSKINSKIKANDQLQGLKCLKFYNNLCF